MEQATHTQAEIAQYRAHMRSTPDSARFFLSIERDEYEQQVTQALLQAIPRLYALNYDDQVDVPHEIHAAIETLERDLGIVMEPEEE